MALAVCANAHVDVGTIYFLRDHVQLPLDASPEYVKFS
jgi:hypothetical protein